MGGVIIDAGTFDYGNGLFPHQTFARVSRFGLSRLVFIAKVRIEGLRDFGGALSPFNGFQIIQGLETLSLRLKQHSENALAIAQWLEDQEEVWVNYPGLTSSKYNDLAKEYLPQGQSSIVTFGLKGGFDKKVADETKIFSLLANIGDSKSLIIHPAYYPSTIERGVAKRDYARFGAPWFRGY